MATCTRCSTSILIEWKYCPNCGLEVAKTKELPERFKLLIQNYEKLTGKLLSEAEKLKFIEDPDAGKLSVIDSVRRDKAGLIARKPIGENIYSLDLGEWLNAVYDKTNADTEIRVWITSRGDKYHSHRDCKGITAGQAFARWKGKETYVPQFITLESAVKTFDLKPCTICSPASFK